MNRWNLREVSREKLADRSLGDKVHRATLRTLEKRSHLVEEIPDWEELRDRARGLRLEAVERQQELLDRFKEAMRQRGIRVTVVHSPQEACELISSLVTEVGTRVTKSKSMASEEIQLNDALEAAGCQVTETDLGELIVQLAHQPPSHVTAPAIHLSVEDIARIFESKLGIEPPDWVREGREVDEATRVKAATRMSLQARQVLRERFLGAEVGISGANFLVAESGTVVLLENEGNIQLTTCLPQRHIVLAGIEKLIARDEDLSVLLRLLPVSATAQRQTCYVSMFADAHPDMHVVLLAQGREELRKDPEQRDLLTCIRCGACMNVCPVYRNVGGHAYGGAYPGPIGSLLLPHLKGMEKFAELPFASSLCGACSEICPVKIPLHERLLQLRARLTEKGIARELGLTLRAAATLMRHPDLMALAERMYPVAKPLASLVPAGKAWTATRDLPAAPTETFRSLYERGAVSQPDRPSAHEVGEGSRTSTSTSTSTTTSTDQGLLDLFGQRLRELGPSGETELHVVSAAEAQTLLREMVAAHEPGQVLIEGETSEKREYELGITSASLLIADTGGVVVDLPQRTRGRAHTLVDTHVAVGSRGQLVAALGEAISARIEKRKSKSWGGYQVFVTGPSRTADIEKVLVIPAHGPRRLVVLITEEKVDLGKLRG